MLLDFRKNITEFKVKQPDKREERRKIAQEIIDGHNFPEASIYAKVAIILSSCIEDLEDSINDNAKSNNLLSKRVCRLNFILTVATVIGTAVAVITLIKNF